MTKRYLIEKPIGEGGSSVVHRAIDTRIGRPVAIKRFKNIGTEAEEHEYLAELEAISRICHSNVVCSYDAGYDDQGGFIVMEFIDGPDVESLVAEQPFDTQTFIGFATQCLEALHATHASGMLHLDIKPSNIMMTGYDNGRQMAKLVDFGRAERCQNERGNQPRGRGMDGSIYYTSPEQFLSEPLDRRTDLYALGCVFYWCLTGLRPFTGENLMIIMASHIQHYVTPLADLAPAVPEWLCDWVMSLIELRADDRPASARQALEILQRGNQAKELARQSA